MVNKGRRSRQASSLPDNSIIEPMRSTSNKNKMIDAKESNSNNYDNSLIVRQTPDDSWDNSVNDNIVDESQKVTFTCRIWLWDGDYYEEQALHSSDNPLVSPWNWAGKLSIFKLNRNYEIYTFSLIKSMDRE